MKCDGLTSKCKHPRYRSIGLVRLRHPASGDEISPELVGRSDLEYRE